MGLRLVKNKSKTSFKKTEAGLIPLDWEIYECADVFDFLKTGSSSRSKLSDGGQVYYIHYGDIHSKWDNRLDFGKDDIPKISEAIVSTLPKLKEGDLIIADASEDYEGIGASIEIKNIGDKKAVAGLHTILLRAKENKIVDGYKAYLTKIKPVKDRLIKIATGTTVYGVSKTQLKKVLVPIPSSSFEQEKIAEALSDVDELIQNLDKLIQKKKLIKKGVMQELLSGNKRLPCFQNNSNGKVNCDFGKIPDDWCLKTLDEVTVPSGLIRGPFGGTLKKKFFVSKGYKIYEQKNAIRKSSTDGDYFIRHEKFVQLKRFEVFPNDFIVSCSGTIGEIYQIPFNAQKGIINQALLIIRLNHEEIDEEYFYQYFSWSRFQERVIDNTQGGAMKNLIGMSEFRSTLIPTPPTIEEQKAIAKVLRDIDDEINTLETNLTKYQQIKSGMMQELLTGKTRLVSKQKVISEKTEEKSKNKTHNWAINEAVVISTLVHKLGSEA